MSHAFSVCASTTSSIAVLKICPTAPSVFAAYGSETTGVCPVGESPARPARNAVAACGPLRPSAAALDVSPVARPIRPFEGLSPGVVANGRGIFPYVFTYAASISRVETPVTPVTIGQNATGSAPMRTALGSRGLSFTRDLQEVRLYGPEGRPIMATTFVTGPVISDVQSKLWRHSACISFKAYVLSHVNMRLVQASR